MHESKVLIAKQKYQDDLYESDVYKFERALKRADDKCFEELMNISIKSKVATLMFSLFLGTFGVDRFYLGDVALGITKLLSWTVFSVLISSIDVIAGIVFLLSVAVWCFVDTFVCWNRSKDINYDMLMSFLKANEVQSNCEYDMVEKINAGKENMYKKINERQNTEEQIEILKKLKEILDMGVITQEEFDKKKAEILNLKQKNAPIGAFFNAKKIVSTFAHLNI